MKKTTAIITILATAVLFLFIGRRTVKMFPNVSIRSGHIAHNYLANRWYTEQTDYHKLYRQPKFNIVLLGDSHVQRVHWNELLNRCDIANRGIGSDVSEGMLNRLDDVIALEPRLTIVEAGANDIAVGVSIKDYSNNMDSIICRLQRNTHSDHIVKVMAILHVTASSPDAVNINKMVDQYNAALKNVAKRKNVEVIDLNPYLCGEDGSMLPKFAQQDGIHLSAEGLKVWRHILLSIVS